MTGENLLSLLLNIRWTATRNVGAVQTALLALSDELSKLFDIWEKVCISRWNLLTVNIQSRNLDANPAKNIHFDPKPIISLSSRHLDPLRQHSFSQMLQDIALSSDLYSLSSAAGQSNTIKLLCQVLWVSVSPLLTLNARRKLCTALLISVIKAEDIPTTHEEYIHFFGNLSSYFAVDLPAVHLYLSVILHHTFLCGKRITSPHVCGKAVLGISNSGCPLTNALVKNFVQNFHDNIHLFPIEFLIVLGVFRVKLRKYIQDKIVIYLSCTKLLVISLLGSPLKTSEWLGTIGEGEGNALPHSCAQCFFEEILRISGVALQHVFAGASDHERNNLTEQLKRDFSTIFSAADEMVTQLLSSRKPTESTEIDEMNYFLQGVCNMFDVVMDPDASEASKTPKINSLSLLEPPCFVISETGLQLLVEAVKRLFSSSPDSKLGPLLSLLSSYDPPPSSAKSAGDSFNHSAGIRDAGCIQEMDSENWITGEESLLVFRLHNNAHMVVDPPPADSQHLLEEAFFLDQHSRMTAEGGRIENSSEKVGASGMTLADLLDASDQDDTDMNELKTFESWLLLSFGRACNRAVSVDDVHAAAAVAPANFSSLASASSTSASSGSSSSPSDSTGAAVPVSVIHRPSPCCSPSCRSRDGAVTSREPRKSAGHAVGKVPVASTSQTESVRLSAPDGVVNEADEQLFSGKRTRFSLISACSHIGQELEDDALEYADRTSVAVPVSDKTSSLRSEDRRSADTDLYVLPERRRVCSLDIAESEEIPESSFSCASPASGPVSLSHSLPHSDLDEEEEEEAAAAAATALFSDRHVPVGLQEPPVHQALSSAKREILLPPSPRRQQHETVRRFGVCSSGDRVWRRSHSQEAAVTRTTASAASNRPPTHAVWTQNSRVRSYLLQERGTDFPPQFPRLARSRSATNLNVRSGVDNSKAAAATIIDDEEATSFNPRAICRRISAPSPPAPKLKAVGVATSTEPWLAATSHPMRATAQAQLGLPRSDSVMPTASGSWTVNFASNVPDSSASVGVTEPREEEEEEDDDGVDSVIEEEEEEDGDNDGDVLSDHHSPSVNLSGRVSPSITSGGRVSPLSTVSGGVLRNYPLAAVCVRPSQGGGGGIFSTLNNITSQSSLSSYFATAASFLRRAEEVSDVTEKFGKFDLPHHPRSNEHETWSMVSEAWSTDVLASDTESINRGGASIGGGVGSAGHSSVLPLPSISLSTSATVASSSSATSHHAPFRCGLHSGYQQPSCPTRRLLPTSTGTNASSQPPTSNRLRRRRRRHHHYHHHGNHAHFGGLPESQRPCAGLPNSSRHHHHHHRNRTLSPTPPVQPSHPFLASPGESLCGLSASDPAPPASHLTMSPATTTPRSVSCNNAVRSDNQQQKHHPPAEDCHDQRQQSIRQLMNGAVSCLNSERHAQLQVEAREAIHPHTGVNMPTTNSDLRIPTRSGGCRKSADHPEASGSREVKDVGRGGPYPSTSRNKPRTSFLLPSDRGPNLNYEDTSSLLSPSVACAAFSVTPNGLSQSVSQFSSANADDSHVSHTAGVFRRLLNCTSRRLLNLLQSEHVPQVISSLQDQQISPLYSMNHSIDTAEDHTMCTFLVALREHAFQLQDASLAWQAHDALLLIRALQCQWPLDRHSVANRLDHIHSSNTYCAGCPVSSRDSSPPPPLSSAARGCGASGRRRRPRRSLNGLPDGVDGATPATQTPQSPLHSSVTAVAGEPSSLALYLAKRVQREARRRENLLAWLEASNVTVSQRRRELEVLHRLVERQLTALRNEALSRLAEEFLAEESVTLAQLRDTVCSELEHLGQTGGRSRGRQTTANDHTTEPHTARILRHLNSFLDNSQPRLLASLSTLPSATATASATSSEVLATIERILMRDLFFLLCTRYPTSLCEAPSADRKFSDMLIQRRKLASSTWLRGLPERYLTLAPFTMAQTELRLINTNYRPVDKLECLRRVLEGISPSYAHSQLPSSPDPRIVSILAYVIIQANPPCFLLNLHFIEHFGARLLRTDPVDMYSRVWRHVKAAVVQLRGGVGPS